jgi:hypothetical protein
VDEGRKDGGLNGRQYVHNYVTQHAIRLIEPIHICPAFGAWQIHLVKLQFLGLFEGCSAIIPDL